MELTRGSVRLAFDKKGSGDQTLIFVHGTGSNRTHLAPLADYFSKNYCCLNIDLCGHGESDKPHKEYTLEGFADDIYWICQELKIKKPIYAGFSMGGNIGIQLATAHPNFLSALIILDSAFLYKGPVLEMVSHYAAMLKSPQYKECIHQIVENGLLPNDQCKKYVEKSLLETPQHVWASAFDNMVKWDKGAESHLRRCQMPMLYIEAANPLVEIAALKEICPQVIYGKIVGSGHSLTVEVPDQVNLMIESFLHKYL